MSDIGFNDNVQVYGRKFHVQTATHVAKGIASCEIFEEGRLINKNMVRFERRRQKDEEQLEKRIRNIVESVHQDTLDEINVMFTIADKIKDVKEAAPHVQMGLLFIKNNMLEDAIAEFKLAIQLNPKAVEAYKQLGLAYLGLQNNAEAIKLLEKALKIEPRYADLHNVAGLAYLSAKQHVKALEFFQQALRINPKYDLARYNLALLYLDSVQSDKSDTHLPPASIRIERTYQQLQALADKKLRGVANVLAKVRKAVQTNKLKTAVKLLEAGRERLLEDDDHNIISISFLLRFMYGGRSISQRTLMKFEKELLEATGRKESYADLWNSLGIVHLIQCRNLFIQALNEFNKALEINPNFEKALKNKKLVENDGKEFLILLRAILK